MRTLAACAMVLCGCVSSGDPPRRLELYAKYQASDYEAASRPGTASISGQAFLRTRGGEVRTAAGLTVSLVPDTNYVRECIDAWDRGFQIDIDDRIPIRRVLGDSAGGFRFDGVAAGSYVISSRIEWTIPGRYPYQTQQTGGRALAFVTVAESQQLSGVIATR